MKMQYKTARSLPHFTATTATLRHQRNRPRNFHFQSSQKWIIGKILYLNRIAFSFPTFEVDYTFMYSFQVIMSLHIFLRVEMRYFPFLPCHVESKKKNILEILSMMTIWAEWARFLQKVSLYNSHFLSTFARFELENQKKTFIVAAIIFLVAHKVKWRTHIVVHIKWKALEEHLKNRLKELSSSFATSLVENLWKNATQWTSENFSWILKRREEFFMKAWEKLVLSCWYLLLLGLPYSLNVFSVHFAHFPRSL